MSKTERLRRAATFAAAAALLWALALPGQRAGARQTPQAAAAPAAKAEAVAATLDEVLRETSEIRKLAVLRPVRSGAQSRAEIERMLVRRLDEDTTPEETRAGELAAKKFGLLPPDFQLRPFIVALLTEQILGYYDPRSQQFYLADWIEAEGQRPVMAHELTHALQDQHFDLRRFEKWPKGDSDAELAAHALIEGDAMLTMLHYVVRTPARQAATLKSMAATGRSEQLDRAPRALRESLAFPYDQGLGWATQVYRRGGWEAVSAAYKDLPRSTEQILHPEKYVAREAPAKIDLADLSATLGRRWRRIESDVSGEWGYYLVLDEFLRDAKESRRAAAGWGGDRYALYENAQTRETLLAQLAAWDTEADAEEFFDAYVRRTERRYAGALTPDTGAAPPPPPSHARRAWRTPEGVVVVERRGARVAILEGTTARSSAGDLLKNLWQ